MTAEMNLRTTRQANQENEMIRPSGGVGKMAGKQAPTGLLSSRPALSNRNPNIEKQSSSNSQQIDGGGLIKKKISYGAHQQSRLTRNADRVLAKPLANIQRQASVEPKPSLASIQEKTEQPSQQPLPPAAVSEDKPMDTASFVSSHLKPVEISEDVSSNSVEMLSSPQIVSSMIPDVDEDDSLSPEMKKYTIPGDFMTNKTITGRMRGVLMDWMYQVHMRFHLLPETMYCTVQIFDRYILATKGIPKSEIQLLGVTSMLIASKYEEMYAPEIADFVYITDDTYTTKQILEMEVKILNTLNCQLGRPLPIRFLRRYSKVVGADSLTHSLAKYFLELSLCEHQLATARPSHIAAASMYLSVYILKTFPELWSASLVHYSQLKVDDFKPLLPKLVRFVTRVHTEKSKLQAVRSKFAQPKYGSVSEMVSSQLDSLRVFATDQ